MLAKKCIVLDVMSVTLGTTNKNNIIYMNYKNIIQFIGAKLKKKDIFMRTKNGFKFSSGLGLICLKVWLA